MRWTREHPFIVVTLLSLAAVAYLLVIWSAFPLLWTYRDYLLVRVLLVFLYGDHLPEVIEDFMSVL